MSLLSTLESGQSKNSNVALQRFDKPLSRCWEVTKHQFSHIFTKKCKKCIKAKLFRIKSLFTEIFFQIQILSFWHTHSPDGALSQKSNVEVNFFLHFWILLRKLMSKVLELEMALFFNYWSLLWGNVSLLRFDSLMFLLHMKPCLE